MRVDLDEKMTMGRLEMSEKNIKIVLVDEKDAVFLSELMNNEEIMTALNEVPTAAEVWVDAIAEWKRDDDEEDYIIFSGDAPVGWLGINGLLSEDKRAYIKMIALLPEYQNCGIGQYVINQIADDLKRRGYVSVGLYTNQSNIKAQQCYIKCGFKITAETAQKMSDGADVKRFKMERSL